MDVSAILDPLNDAQREAVTAPRGAALVLAGAGSGKTRVLVHRIAWLIQVESVSPYQLLAVTFTNKAAQEMRARIEELLSRIAGEQYPLGPMWVGTFHGLAHRMLRAHWREAALPQAFQILDSDDQLRLVKRVMKSLEIDEAQWPPRQIQGFINARKDEGVRPAHAASLSDPYAAQMVRMYEAYEAACQRAGLVDFAELLLRSFELLRDDIHLLDQYRRRFAHVLVDEFQDTNTLQYAWLRQIAGTQGKLFVVGDDDQSIYGWRGARIENIQRFNKDFAGADVYRLEQNYRSTGNILAAANALIAHNAGRLGKELWTEGGEGDPIFVYSAFNDLDEARYVVDRIQQHVLNSGARRDCAVLYRSNAQSRVLEEALLAVGMPYRVYGGLRFFERAEIKDALAYLRLIASRDDDASFERVVNTPTRGIGDRSLEVVRGRARTRNVPLWNAAREVIVEGLLPARAATALRAFVGLIEELASSIAHLQLWEQIDAVVRRSGLIEHFRKEKGEKGEARIENLEELGNAARQFAYNADSGLGPLAAFLSHAALEAGEGQGDAWEDTVQLMSLHSAKGLEFPLVFICGAEEGLFPHQMSMNDPSRLEEERRLCYVGITRAREQLYITHAESRRLHGQEIFPKPSRFLNEIPAALLREVRPRATVMRTQYGGAAPRPEPRIEEPAAGLRLGQRVRHAKFGEGVIVNCEGNGAQARVQVNFKNDGSKWLMLAYANLEIL